MKNRIHILNIFIIAIVTIYSVVVNRILLVSQLDIYSNYLITFFSSIGFYLLLVMILYKCIQNNDFLLKLYWGKLYLKGYWYYHYTLGDKKYYGITMIEQDLYGINTIGFGIDETGNQRANARSVTQLIENNNAYDIVCVRCDLLEEDNNYSKTTLQPDKPTKNSFFSIKVPTKMRAITHIYGGKQNGTLHKDVVFRKFENAKCEDDIIDFLMKKIKEEKEFSNKKRWQNGF